ncbi:hypothetical protein [Nocardia sp. NPDC051981]|uniref:hypothetical protein n=1 Tax=Nocardia sp. NPDC051981 TaxID=3155417 RepID=UPI00344916FD
MTIFLVIVIAFFTLLFAYAIRTMIVHRDTRPRARQRGGALNDFGISSDTSQSGIPPHHGGHPDSSGHHGGHSDSGGHHTTS